MAGSGLQLSAFNINSDNLKAYVKELQVYAKDPSKFAELAPFIKISDMKKRIIYDNSKFFSSPNFDYNDVIIDLISVEMKVGNASYPSIVEGKLVLKILNSNKFVNDNNVILRPELFELMSYRRIQLGWFNIYKKNTNLIFDEYAMIEKFDIKYDGGNTSTITVNLTAPLLQFNKTEASKQKIVLNDSPKIDVKNTNLKRTAKPISSAPLNVDTLMDKLFDGSSPLLPMINTYNDPIYTSDYNRFKTINNLFGRNTNVTEGLDKYNLNDILAYSSLNDDNNTYFSKLQSFIYHNHIIRGTTKDGKISIYDWNNNYINVWYGNKLDIDKTADSSKIYFTLIIPKLGNDIHNSDTIYTTFHNKILSLASKGEYELLADNINKNSTVCTDTLMEYNEDFYKKQNFFQANNIQVNPIKEFTKNCNIAKLSAIKDLKKIIDNSLKAGILNIDNYKKNNIQNLETDLRNKIKEFWATNKLNTISNYTQYLTEPIGNSVANSIISNIIPLKLELTIDDIEDKITNIDEKKLTDISYIEFILLCELNNINKHKNDNFKLSTNSNYSKYISSIYFSKNNILNSLNTIVELLHYATYLCDPITKKMFPNYKFDDMYNGYTFNLKDTKTQNSKDYYNSLLSLYQRPSDSKKISLIFNWTWVYDSLTNPKIINKAIESTTTEEYKKPIIDTESYLIYEGLLHSSCFTLEGVIKLINETYNNTNSPSLLGNNRKIEVKIHNSYLSLPELDYTYILSNNALKKVSATDSKNTSSTSTTINLIDDTDVIKDSKSNIDNRLSHLKIPTKIANNIMEDKQNIFAVLRKIFAYFQKFNINLEFSVYNENNRENNNTYSEPTSIIEIFCVDVLKSNLDSWNGDMSFSSDNDKNILEYTPVLDYNTKNSIILDLQVSVSTQESLFLTFLPNINNNTTLAIFANGVKYAGKIKNTSNKENNPEANSVFQSLNYIYDKLGFKTSDKFKDVKEVTSNNIQSIYETMKVNKDTLLNNGGIQGNSDISKDDEFIQNMINYYSKTGTYPSHLLFGGYRITIKLLGCIGFTSFQTFVLRNSGLYDGIYYVESANHFINKTTFTTTLEAILLIPRVAKVST